MHKNTHCLTLNPEHPCIINEYLIEEQKQNAMSMTKYNEWQTVTVIIWDMYVYAVYIYTQHVEKLR